jgi:hypothetical protein
VAIPEEETDQRFILESLDIAILHVIHTATSGSKKLFNAIALQGQLRDMSELWPDLDAKTLKKALDKLCPMYVSIKKKGKHHHHSLTDAGRKLLAENPLKSD